MTAGIDLFASFVRLRDDGRAEPAVRTFGSQATGWHVMTFHAKTDADVHADHCEIHTEADELVACLSGGLRIYLRTADGGVDESDVLLPAGQATVVPRGRWHRIRLERPSDIMSITCPRGSRLEPCG